MANPTLIFRDIDSGEEGAGEIDVRVSRTATGTITFENLNPGAGETLVGGDGGFTIFGGVSASQNFTLVATQNATKGFIFLGDDTTSKYDQTNHDLIISNVAGAVAGSSTRLDVVSSGTGGGIVITVYDNGNNPFYNGQRARGTLGAPSGVLSGDALMTFGGTGHNGTSLLTFSRTSCRFFAAENWGVAANGTYMELWTTSNGTTTQVGRYRVDNTGDFIMLANYNIIPNTDNQGTVGTAAKRFSSMSSLAYNVYAAASDANPTSQMSDSNILLGVGGATALDVRWRRVSAGLSVFDNNTAKRPLIVDATNNRIGGTSIDDTFTPTFDLDFEKQGTAIGLALTTYGDFSEAFGRRANGTKAAPTGVVNNNVLFRLTGDGWDTAAFQFGATIDFQSSETWSGTARGERIVFQTTANAGTTLSEKWRIENSGNFIMNGNLSVLPTTDSNGIFGTSALRFSDMVSNLFRVFGTVSDANPSAQLSTGAVILGAGGATALDARMRWTAAATITFDNNGAGGVTLVPATTNTGVIGTNALKWNRIRATSVVTGDLEMCDEERNAHWVFREETDQIVVSNKITGKKYLLGLKEIK